MTNLASLSVFKGIPKLALGILSCFILAACSTLPDTPHIAESNELDAILEETYAQSTALSDNDRDNDNLTQETTLNTTLHRAVDEQNISHPNLSGYYPIVTGAGAYASRSILTDMASTSIDVQYYIWHNDESGQLLLKNLWEAAERGVIVRLLLDDFNNNAELDAHLRRFASHPNTAVRLVNPMAHRQWQAVNYITAPKRINHRMHNKSMTFDRQLSIIGGRNIGNEYLSNDKSSQFADLDVLLIGNVVNDITESFEDYWHSTLSYDIETLIDTQSQNHNANDDHQHDFIAHLDKINSVSTTDNTPDKTLQQTNQDSSVYQRAIAESTIDSDLINKQLPFRWAPIRFLCDDVNKLTNEAAADSHLVNQLQAALGTPTKKLTIISSYFVPTKKGVHTLVKLANQGVDINILTNSFKATDVAAVHAGYAEWRTTLLAAGIEIYELKAIASDERRENKLWKARSQSSTSLHAKAFAVDDYNFFIGSYNVDPRSANINTEMGVIINDDDPVQYLHGAINDDLLSIAYKVVLTDEGRLQWQTLEHSEVISHNQEPDVDLADTIWLKIMSHLPIDWLL